MGRMVESVKRKWRELLAQESEPHCLALGAAIGFLSGILPIVPLQATFALVFAFLTRSSKAAAFLGSWWANPFTWPLIYGADALVGSWFVPFDTSRLDFPHLFSLSHMEFFREAGALLADGLWVLMAGGVVLGIPLTIAVYFVVLRAARRVQVARARQAA